ncbi:hypothetical protein ABCR94_13455 [Streptomyces sp. 21So2-11]|uniref:hypothetical protein n=1 Tax=Streptomyces sp. 21So2-11 TaxID=3144408 RepID=UPI00321BA319
MTDLSDGGLLLRAIEDIRDYHGRPIENVFDAPHSLLPEGCPLEPRAGTEDDRPRRVYLDAREGWLQFGSFIVNVGSVGRSSRTTAARSGTGLCER